MSQFGSWQQFIDRHKLDWQTPANKVVGTLYYPSRNKEGGRVFSAFKRTPFEKTNVVIIGQDPYPQPGMATGLAFEHPENKRMSSSLEIINRELSRTYNKPANVKNLQYLADQGVLLLNSSLTVVPGQVGSHAAIWKKFVKDFIVALTSERFVVVSPWGAKAQDICGSSKPTKKNPVPTTNVLPLFGSTQIDRCHPNKDAYSGRDCFVGSDVFREINDALEYHNKPLIEWLQ